MSYASVFMNNRTQSVRIPADMRFADHVKQVMIRKVGNERILSPVDGVWDSFFLSDERVSDDFMVDKASAKPSERLTFD
ncbi:antitoxin [Moraxella caviae]|uniref:Antitoxin n=1 Tax=Moraxella caviae TaxID=34060 RepID=A0A1T0A2J1_9GAMM|nr:type II toxin-antitoxin system VapB family antitoxin [Moraxella caviae]OOR89944.1 antitoxin [Moraxella caviae]STZ14330.1 Antitoxin VapB [Moraxella caviae]